MKRLTDERFASIPAMIEQGFSKAGVQAAMWGVKISTLQVQCSRRGVSLRKGGHLLPRRQLSLPDAPLTLTNTGADGGADGRASHGRGRGSIGQRSVKTITRDDLYKAVLDVEEAA